MSATYLFKEETVKGQKKLRVGTRKEFEDAVQKSNESGEEDRRYFIREKSLDPNQPDLLIIEVDLEEYQKWKKEQVVHSRNYRISKQYQHVSIEDILREMNHGKCDEPALYGADSAYEQASENILRDKLYEELSEWKPWAVDLLKAYLSGKKAICPYELAEKYSVSLQTARKYVRQFEQRIIIFLEGVSF